MKNRCVRKRAVSKTGYAISIWVYYARKVSCFGPINFKRTPIVSIPLPLDSFFRNEQLSCWTLFEICIRRASNLQITEMTPEFGPFCNFRKFLYIRHNFSLITKRISPQTKPSLDPPPPKFDQGRCQGRLATPAGSGRMAAGELKLSLLRGEGGGSGGLSDFGSANFVIKANLCLV